jgi:hypothetical protein
MCGDQPDDNQPQSVAEREYYTLLAHALQCEAKRQSLDFTSVIMQGCGHDFPHQYETLLGAWVRGERLPE